MIIRFLIIFVFFITCVVNAQVDSELKDKIAGFDLIIKGKTIEKKDCSYPGDSSMYYTCYKVKIDSIFYNSFSNDLVEGDCVEVINKGNSLYIISHNLSVINVNYEGYQFLLHQTSVDGRHIFAPVLSSIAISPRYQTILKKRGKVPLSIEYATGLGKIFYSEKEVDDFITSLIRINNE